MNEIWLWNINHFIYDIVKACPNKSFRSRVPSYLQDIYHNFVVKPIYLSTVKIYFCSAIAVWCILGTSLMSAMCLHLTSVLLVDSGKLITHLSYHIISIKPTASIKNWTCILIFWNRQPMSTVKPSTFQPTKNEWHLLSRIMQTQLTKCYLTSELLTIKVSPKEPSCCDFFSGFHNAQVNVKPQQLVLQKLKGSIFSFLSSYYLSSLPVEYSYISVC